MGLGFKFKRASTITLTSALLWTSLAWGAPWNRIDEELELVGAEAPPLIEHDPCADERSTCDEALSEIFAVAAGEARTCAECGHENKADANFCVKCGAPLPSETAGAVIHCPKCGAENAEDAKFCTACGYSLTEKKPTPRATLERPPKMGVYFAGGYASYGVVEIGMTSGERDELYKKDMGRVWSVGAGFVLPLWSRAGIVPISLELSTDACFSTVNEPLEIGSRDTILYHATLLPIREEVIFGAAFGPREMIKAFCGTGGGFAILKSEYASDDEILSRSTNRKPVFGIPFGCEIYVTPRLAFAGRADYLLIPGDIETEFYIGRSVYRITASTPDVFILGAAARLGF